MMTLDERARSAAQGLQATVETAIPVPPPFPPIRVVPVWLRPALTFALSAVIVAAGAFLISRPEPQVADLPDPTTPVVIDPTVPDSTTSTLDTTTITMADEEVEPAGVDAGGVPAPGGATDVTPPMIEILEPADGARFTESRLTFSGVTEPGAKVSFGPFEANVDDQGNWSIVLVLSEGGNRATAVATDAAGNTSEASVAVYLDLPATTTVPKEEPPPEEPPKEEPPAVAEFHAEQLYGTCAENPPYDVFFGTGEPGHTVKVSSEHGSGITTINGDGAFEIKVFFETAPMDVPIAVTVKDKDTGETFVFEFVRTG